MTELHLHGGPLGPSFLATKSLELPLGVKPVQLRMSTLACMEGGPCFLLMARLNRIIRLAGCRPVPMSFLEIVHEAVYEYYTTTADGTAHFIYDRLETP